jgi:hypothetical protein
MTLFGDVIIKAPASIMAARNMRSISMTISGLILNMPPIRTNIFELDDDFSVFVSRIEIESRICSFLSLSVCRDAVRFFAAVEYSGGRLEIRDIRVEISVSIESISFVKDW